jgi:hypothetical protein
MTRVGSQRIQLATEYLNQKSQEEREQRRTLKTQVRFLQQIVSGLDPVNLDDKGGHSSG